MKFNPRNAFYKKAAPPMPGASDDITPVPPGIPSGLTGVSGPGMPMPPTAGGGSPIGGLGGISGGGLGTSAGGPPMPGADGDVDDLGAGVGGGGEGKVDPNMLAAILEKLKGMGQSGLDAGQAGVDAVGGPGMAAGLGAGALGLGGLAAYGAHKHNKNKKKKMEHEKESACKFSSYLGALSAYNEAYPNR